ncbi:MAG: prepilin-type N-terminal cleavage/methylation domain-containing protein [Deltaproteobacteria bacterium]|nr:prepilin-type N-terminal cleavage/methylation domain-containing protein [Deltaproteobacteria bacterium]
MKKGFTLIEVMVALAIFSFIAMATGGSVSRSTFIQKRIEKEWMHIHSLRTVFHILQRDLSLAFHVPKEKMAGTTFLKGQFEENPYFKTYFMGRATSLSFTSLAHRKLYRSAHESELCEIGYSVEQDKDNAQIQNLTRRKSPVVDEQPESGGEKLVLFENIKKIQFRYYSKKQDRWTEDWNSQARDTEDLFPDAVELELTYLEPPQDKEKIHKLSVIVQNPNNEAPKVQGETSPGPGGGSTPAPPGGATLPSPTPQEDSEDEFE